MNGFYQSFQKRKKEAFCKTLDTLYWKSKRQRQAGFPDVIQKVMEHKDEGAEDGEK